MSFQDQMDQDLHEVFYDPEEFGADITYTPQGGSSQTIKGLFRKEGEGALAEGEYLQVNSVRSRVDLRQTDVPNIARDDELTINGVTYLVKRLIEGAQGYIKVEVVEK